MKKILSIFLAILMAFSCLTVSFAAQAQPDLSQYTPSKVNFHLFPKKSADKLADRCTAVLSALIDVAFQADPDFKKVDDIVSNKTFKYFFMAFYKDMTPAECAAVFSEDSFAGAKFAGAKEVLSAAQSWDEVTFKSGDFDFVDGDLDGFLDSVSIFFYYDWVVSNDHDIKIDLQNQGIHLGYEEGVITIIEFLGMEAVPWEEIVKRAEEQGNESVAYVRAILEPIIKSMLDFLKNPGDMLWDFIVRVCYILDTGMINAIVEDFAEKYISDPTDKEEFLSLLPELNTGALYNLANEAGIPLFDGLSEEQVVQAIHNVAGCGTVVENPDKPGNFILKADKGKTVVCIFNTILDWQKTKEFVKAVVEPMYPNRPVTRTFMVVYMMLYARLMPRALVYGEFSLLLSTLAKTISKAVV